MNNKTLCTLIKPYVCRVCRNDTLFFLTTDDRLIDYKAMIETECMNSDDIYKNMTDMDVILMKCIHCNREFMINWTDIKYPTMVKDVKSVINQFSKDEI